jgi:hypothetical protein
MKKESIMVKIPTEFLEQISGGMWNNPIGKTNCDTKTNIQIGGGQGLKIGLEKIDCGKSDCNKSGSYKGPKK